MNVDVERFVRELRYFETDGEAVYIPAFTLGLNRFYRTGIVLLGSKQYHRLIQEYVKGVQYRRYDAKPFQHSFSNCELLAEADEDCIVFHPILHH